MIFSLRLYILRNMNINYKQFCSYKSSILEQVTNCFMFTCCLNKRSFSWLNGKEPLISNLTMQLYIAAATRRADSQPVALFGWSGSLWCRHRKINEIAAVIIIIIVMQILSHFPLARAATFRSTCVEFFSSHLCEKFFHGSMILIYIT